MSNQTPYLPPSSCGLNPAGDQILATYPGGYNPTDTVPVPSTQLSNMIWVPSNGNLYATDPTANSVLEISPTGGGVLGTIPVGTGPTSLAFDTSTGYPDIYVANYGTSTVPGSVSVIDTTTNTVISTVTLGLGSDPYGVAFNSALGEMFVTNSGYGTVSAINQVTGGVTTYNVGTDPQTIIFVPSNNEMYDGDATSNTVSVTPNSAGPTPVSWHGPATQSPGARYDAAMAYVDLGARSPTRFRAE